MEIKMRIDYLPLINCYIVFKFLGAGVAGVILVNAHDLVAKGLRLDQGRAIIHLQRMVESIALENHINQIHAM